MGFQWHNRLILYFFLSWKEVFPSIQFQFIPIYLRVESEARGGRGGVVVSPLNLPSNTSRSFYTYQVLSYHRHWRRLSVYNDVTDASVPTLVYTAA